MFLEQPFKTNTCVVHNLNEYTVMLLKMDFSPNESYVGQPLG